MINQDCKNELCIYQNKDLCTLNYISINEYGICDSYISPNIPTELLQKYKNDSIQIHK